MKTSDWLKKYNIQLKKSLGQNFLSTSEYAKKIVKKGSVTEEDTVIEIGPGAGTLTEEIAKTGAKLYAFEIDERLKPLLLERFKEYQNVEIQFIDFLKANISEIQKPKYIANIPYYITSPILEKIFFETPDFQLALLMVQKEYGERMMAKSGKNYSPLSIFVQFFCKVEKVLNVPPHAFIPNPKVDSVVLKLTPKEDIPDINKKGFFKFVHVAFSQRRKTIRNNLKGLIKDRLDELLEKSDIDPKTRPENISIEKFIILYNNYMKLKNDY
ncbi:dimethyladenosine transferase [Marinitoga sp. 1135]|uniref:Ribosomal RNA small subunit methyltransferase A n=1 Tax=Marinitoga piezophila (strain DSM 14283 / JCM 11233 / KA3) TaxID=443254 RepID=H2J7Q4_MARPK|nr:MULTISPECIES: 16S rRNA (adenine(1518)-N(6)/adenine(1519)-N(6))-dimethyltransferase RsmA [Marinitoga]AEX85395.1 dimethyladenosine transferase [Marinitoga piezophila KA3]APT75871.1 dimethyladenosine transferase [Marinitoga sp. 1137]NUU95594.1 dimethyladenosine transferase [Marinitoga sp. 1135]NUU97526.1 dimethyladenosine transferase [Marinitoga sp. 1138]